MTFRKGDNEHHHHRPYRRAARLEGRGIAAKLVNHAIADAREQGFKITPVCSYVVAQFRRHPEWADLRA